MEYSRNDSRNTFSEFTIERTNVKKRVGAIFGSVTVHVIRRVPAPSILAASVMSLFIAVKAVRSSIMFNPEYFQR